MDSTSRALKHTFAAKLALCKIDVCEIVLHGNRAVRAGLRTFAATDAGCLTCLASNSALVLIDTRDENPHIARSFCTEFDDILRAGLHACSAGGALVLVNLRKPSLRIHVNSVELAGCHAVTAAKTAVGATRVTAVERSLHAARLHPVVSRSLRTVFA